MLPLETIRQAPKALLHDHLDGGLRPATIIDLAAEYRYDGLPTRDPDELATWIRRGADRKNLELYLADNCQAWVLQPDGHYVREQPGTREPVAAQTLLLQRLAG